MIYLLVVAVILAAAVLAYGAANLLHLHGMPLTVLIAVIAVAGLIAAVAILVIHFRAKKRDADGVPDAGGEQELDVLLDDANRKLRSAQMQGPKSLNALPLLYLLGEAGAAKTTIVLRSGLDPELIAGSAPREGDVSPTPLLNIWFTRQVAILEAGEAIRQSLSMLNQVVARTRPRVYRSRAPVRAAVVCVSLEQFLVGDAATSSLVSARAVGAQLRQISKLLGAALPVYVLFTKLDRVPHFAEYVQNLSHDEVHQVLGKTLVRTDASAGVYADKITNVAGGALEALTFSLAEFRIEMLGRETEPRNSPGVYEFPREFGKLRKNLIAYLLELCKPSQLSANPYLRGFYFTGVRALVVDQAVGGPPPPPMQSTAGPEVGATRVFSVQDLQAAPRFTPQPGRGATRAPQWAFLSRIFPETILGDRSALSATQQTAPARFFRRALYASLALLFALAALLFTVSYFNNLNLETRILGAARSLPVSLDAPAAPPLGQLQALDQLRLTILQLDDYRKNGPPLSYRFGLYQGDTLDTRARQIYFEHFRPILLNGAQANFVSYLRALPNLPAPAADYTAAYNPLKAYLMTTSNPEKTVPVFLTPLLLQYWTHARTSDPAQYQLARQQFDFYVNELLRQNPYSITPDISAVGHARAYLSNFGAEQHIYQDMQAAAEKTNPGIDFNRLYPNSAGVILEPHLVRGAFTRSGFAFMQDVFQHTDRFFQGETWVLGPQSAGSLDTPTVSKKLSTMYVLDFIKEWRAFLADAKFANCGALHESADKLALLAAPESPILEFFYTVSSNTAVADPQIKAIFQPAQALVDPNATARFIGPGNNGYINSLLTLSNAVNQFNQVPDTAKETAKDPLNAAVSAAELVVQQTAQGFNIDPQTHTEKVVTGLLDSPIRCVVPPPPPPPPGPPAAMCTTLGKFPFLPLSKVQAGRDLSNSEQASLDDVNAVFAPGTGKLWTYYNDNLKQLLVLQGSKYVVVPGAEAKVGPAFASFFNRAARVSAALYSSAGTIANFNFTLRAIPTKGVENATLVVDGQRIPEGSTTQQFKWNGAVAHSASLSYNFAGALQYQGTWSLFQLISMAHVTLTATGMELEFPIEVSGRPSTLPDGTPVVVRFEVTGPGAAVLQPGGLYALPCVTTVTK